MAHRKAYYEPEKNGHPPVIPKTKSPYSLKELFSALFHQDADSEPRLEIQFSSIFNFPYGLFFNYGRSGLYALLKVLGYEGVEVLIPAYTCVVVANAIVLSGNNVKFADNEPDHFNVSPEMLASYISSSTKMVIPTPLFGYPIDWKRYENVIFQKAPGAFILYDDAQGYGLYDQDDLQSTHTDGAFFGLGEGKVISSIYGGMLLLRDRSLYEEVKAYRDREFHTPNSFKCVKRFIYGLGYWAAYRTLVAYFFDYLNNKTGLLDSLKNDRSSPSLPVDTKERPTNLQARLGRLQLGRLEEIMEERRRLARLYERKFHEKGISFFSSNGKPSNSHFPCLTKDRDLAIGALRRYGIMAGYPFLKACPDLPGYEDYSGKYPNASLMAKKLITLPIWHGMTESHVNHVVHSFMRCKDKNPDIF